MHVNFLTSEMENDSRKLNGGVKIEMCGEN
jgi:hypothetical protein